LRVLCILDKKCHAHPPSPWYVYKIFILCQETGGELTAGMETFGAKFFGKDELPEISDHRNTKEQILLMFDYLNDPSKPLFFD
jgi:hypothetical protein